MRLLPAVFLTLFMSWSTFGQIYTICTVAGGGSSFGDNGPATSAQLSLPSGVAVDSTGNLYIADSTKVHSCASVEACDRRSGF